MIMTGQLAMSLMPMRAYVGNAWTSLMDAEKEQMLQLIRSVERVLYEHNFENVFVSLREHPHEGRTRRGKDELYTTLRKEMARCHLFLALSSGPSEGLHAEIENARAAMVPAILLVRRGKELHELAKPLALNCVGEITHSGIPDAIDQLETLLSRERQCIERHAMNLDMLRRRASVQIGTTVSYLRTRLGWSRQYLAQRAGISEVALASIEEECLAFNPPLLMIAALASALDTDVAHLGLPPQEWLDRETQLYMGEVAKEEGWSVEAFDEYRSSSWRETRSNSSPSKEDIRQAMQAWQATRDQERW